MTTPPAPSGTDRLDAIRSRLDAATPAPWKASVVDSPRSTCSTAIYSHAYAAGDARSEVLPSYPIKAGYARMRRADAVLMANARDDLAHLLGLVGDLQGQLDKARERLDAAERQLAPFAAQHRPCKNMFRTCVTCRDGYGEPIPWPCKDAKRLGLVADCPACAAPVLKDTDRECPKCDAEIPAWALGLGGEAGQ